MFFINSSVYIHTTKLKVFLVFSQTNSGRKIPMYYTREPSSKQNNKTFLQGRKIFNSFTHLHSMYFLMVNKLTQMVYVIPPFKEKSVYNNFKPWS